MAHGSYEDAVRVLRNRMSGRWDGTEVDGRDAMMDALKSELGYSSHQANETIDAMIESGTLRYHQTNNLVDAADATDSSNDSSNTAENTAIAGAALGGVGLGGVSGASGGAPIAAPLAIGALAGAGFWQIGADDSEDNGMGDKAPMEGRAGQIDPTS